MNEPICELPKNSRETYHFRLGEYQNHKFVDMRIFAKEDGKDPAPPRRGLRCLLVCGPNSGEPSPRWKRP